MSDALAHFVEERDLLLAVRALGCVEPHVDVLDAGQAVGHAGEVLVVGYEEGQAARLGDDVLEDRLGYGRAVVGAGPAAELVHDDEAAGGGGAQDAGRLGDLDHEGRLAGEEVVARPRAGVDGVAEGHGQGRGRDEGAHLGEQDDEGRRADKGGLAAHVGPRDEMGQGRGVGEGGGEGDVGRFEGVLGHGVAAFRNGDRGLGGVGEEVWFGVALLSGDLGEGKEAVDGRESGNGVAQGLSRWSRGGP